MMTRSCLLAEIGRRKNGWHPTIFDVEEECHLLGSWVIVILSTVKHVNGNLVTLEVAI